ncbi:Agamous-like MADS-box protein AGL62 [Bienertia sinuspersici]
MASSSSASSSVKKSKGRQKVNMVRMEKDSNRQVTFSKRRCGLFKKASELCTLCGAEAAVIVFSPGRKAYTFGHPSVDVILNRFILSQSSSSFSSSESNTTEAVVEVAQRNAFVSDLNIQLNFVNNQIEIVQKSSEEINNIKKAKEQLYWWDRAIEELSFQHLVHLKAALDELKKHVIQHGKNLIMLEASNAANHFPIMGINHPMLACFDGAMINPNNGFFAYGQNYF